jgi:hypothetical protein
LQRFPLRLAGRRLAPPILAFRRQSVRRRGRRVAVPVAVLGSHMFIIDRWSRPTAPISILVTTIRQCLITILGAYVPIRGTLSTAFPCKDPATRPPSASLGALNSRQLDPRALLAGDIALDRSIDAILAAFVFGFVHFQSRPWSNAPGARGRLSESRWDLADRRRFRLQKWVVSPVPIVIEDEMVLCVCNTVLVSRT